ncbi:MAG: hypothetical protein MSG64_16635 [Pyrinomonadaceae bacterium MAG19_C2-C3]|nr:hypothetical protein [Pyrinomonadaceae bacterium MAG19_C2-C3]
MSIFAPVTRSARAEFVPFVLSFPVEVPDADLVGARDARINRYAARLIVSGVEIPITDFNFSEPADRLGAVLNATLAEPLSETVTRESSITFQIGVWVDSGFRWVTLLDGARLSSRSHALNSEGGRPSDRVSFTTADGLADKSNRAPARPVTFYDPAVVTIEPESANASLESLRAATGAPIRTDFRARPSLNLHSCLHALYVTGCSFPVVHTNLPNYPVDRVDVSIEAGWDAAARALINAFAPIIYTDAAGALWIVDTALPLPEGSPAPRVLSLSNVRAMEDGLSAGQPSERLILSYRVRANAGEYFTERIETERSEAGTYGTNGFTETTTERKVREHRMLSEPANIVREEVVEVTTTVRNHQLEIVTRAKQQDQIDSQGRKSGHARTVESLVPQLPSGDLLLQVVQEEKQSIAYRPHPRRPSESVISSSVTYLAGLALEDNDNQYRDEPFKLPYTDAHRNGFIDKDADQEAVFQALRTTTENFRQRGDSEVEIETIVSDHLANTTERSSSQTRAGSLSLGASATGREGRRVLLTTNDNQLVPVPLTNRKVPAFDAGDVPDVIARAMGARQLARLANPPREARVDLPSLDLTSHRGSGVVLPSRTGSLTTYIIAGQSITGRTENGALVIAHSFEARESR